VGPFLFQMTLRDLVRPRRILVWALIVMALYGLSEAYRYVNPSETEQDAYVQLSGLLVYRVLALAAAIFSAAVISQEIEQRTIVYLVTRPISRPLLLLSRLAATVLVVFSIGFLAAVAVSLATHGSQAFSNEILWRDAKGLLIGAAAYSTLFVFFSLLMNRSMLVSLFFAFGWETFVPNIPGDAYRLSIFPYLKAIAERPTTGAVQNPLGVLSGKAGPDLASAQTGYLAMGAFVLGLAVLSTWWFKNFEYLPREDAE
jgi:ABC-2 type transport system permease protein